MDATIGWVQSRGMKWIASLVVALAACHRDPVSVPSTAPPAYAADIGKVCDVITRSGAQSMGTNDRNYTVANWLGSNLETPESHAFLVKIQPLVGEAKARALELEAARVGIGHCALADVWRTPTPEALRARTDP